MWQKSVGENQDYNLMSPIGRNINFVYTILGLLVLLLFGWYVLTVGEGHAEECMHKPVFWCAEPFAAQRDEFDNIFHSIREGVITYDADFQ